MRTYGINKFENRINRKDVERARRQRVVLTEDGGSSEWVKVKPAHMPSALRDYISYWLASGVAVHHVYRHVAHDDKFLIRFADGNEDEVGLRALSSFTGDAWDDPTPVVDDLPKGDLHRLLSEARAAHPSMEDRASILANEAWIARLEAAILG